MSRPSPSIENYKEHLKIDKYNLDEEVLMQPSLYAFYAEMYPEAIEKRDRLKVELDGLYADLDKEIRDRANDEGKKITEKAIESVIISDAEYLKAQKDYIEAVGDANKLYVVKTAFEMRKDALEQAVRLFLSGYFNEVRIEKQEKSFEKSTAAMRIEEIRRKRKDERNSD